MSRTPTAWLATSLMAALTLTACGGSGGLSAPSEEAGDGGGGGGTAAQVTTSWAPSDSDWYLYGAESMKVIEKSSDLQVTVQESAGSEENAIRMDAGAADVGMIDVQGANTALGEDHELATLYPISIVLWQMIVGADTGITSLEDLDGEKWNPGPIGGGSTDITIGVLEGMGIAPNYYEADLGPAVSAYSGRQATGFSYRGAGVQATSAVLEAAASRPIHLINLTDQEIEQAQKTNPDLVPITIPGGTYPDVKEDTQTFGYWGVVVGARGDLPEDVAYEVTRTFWENIETIRERLPQTKDLTPQKAIDELMLPLHPGAARYYEEIGIEIAEDQVR